MEFILLEFPSPNILNLTRRNIQKESQLNIEHLEKTVQQKAKEAKPEIQKLLPKLMFFPEDFQLIKDGGFQGGIYSKVWAKMYNDKTTSMPQTNFRKIFMRDGQIKKGKKLTVTDMLGTTFKGIAFCNLSALFLNTNNKSIRLVAEDVGVLEIFERKSAFDKYSDEEDESLTMYN